MTAVPLEQLKVGDCIIGPFGSYELRVDKITANHIVGTYTKVPPHGYPLGDRAVYLKLDWNTLGGFQYAPASD